MRTSGEQSPGGTGLPSATATEAKGRGIMNLSQLRSLAAGNAPTPYGTTGTRLLAGIRDTPGFALHAGPAGPSGVMAPGRPSASDLTSSLAAETPPLDEEPLTGEKPIFSQTDDTSVPSRLLLIIILMPMFLWV